MLRFVERAMGDAPAESLREWIGRTQVQHDELSLFPARAMTTLLDGDPAAIEPGSPLPAGWHWLYFRPTSPRTDLGADGHPRRGAFLPPVELPRRMWAGGRLRFHAALRLGDPVKRVSTVRDVTLKQGRSGTLVFVTVHHRVSGPAGAACDEEQDIVYREAPRAAGRPAGAPELEALTAWREEFRPDRVALFQFSALTFNSHRIHYDQPYAVAEGYPDIVVHGPLIALLLLRAARLHASGREPARFEYRAVSPMYVDEPIQLRGESPRENRMRLWATDSTGRIAMEATAGW